MAQAHWDGAAWVATPAVPRQPITPHQAQEILQELLEAAEPFTSGEVVMAVSATIPLMARLEVALEQARVLLAYMARENV